MFKRIVSVILAVIISAMFPFAAFAEEYDTPAEDVIIEEYQYTQSAVAGLSISSKKLTTSWIERDSKWTSYFKPKFKFGKATKK